jgi:hypothetical protein
LKKHATIKEKRIKREHLPEWFTDEIKYIIHEIDKYRIRDYYHNVGKYDQYKLLRNKIPSMIKKSKRDFFNNAIKNNQDPAFFWKNLKDVSKLYYNARQTSDR